MYVHLTFITDRRGARGNYYKDQICQKPILKYLNNMRYCSNFLLWTVYHKVQNINRPYTSNIYHKHPTYLMLGLLFKCNVKWEVQSIFFTGRQKQYCKTINFGNFWMCYISISHNFPHSLTDSLTNVTPRMSRHCDQKTLKPVSTVLYASVLVRTIQKYHYSWHRPLAPIT